MNNEFFKLIEGSTDTLLLGPVVQVSNVRLPFQASDICIFRMNSFWQNALQDTLARSVPTVVFIHITEKTASRSVTVKLTFVIIN